MPEPQQREIRKSACCSSMCCDATLKVLQDSNERAQMRQLTYTIVNRPISGMERDSTYPSQEEYDATVSQLEKDRTEAKFDLDIAVAVHKVVHEDGTTIRETELPPPSVSAIPTGQPSPASGVEHGDS